MTTSSDNLPKNTQIANAINLVLRLNDGHADYSAPICFSRTFSEALAPMEPPPIEFEPSKPSILSAIDYSDLKYKNNSLKQIDPPTIRCEGIIERKENTAVSRMNTDSG